MDETCRRCKGAATREVDFAWWCDECLVAHQVSTATLLKDLLEQHATRCGPMAWRGGAYGQGHTREVGPLKQTVRLRFEGDWEWHLDWRRDDQGYTATLASGLAKSEAEAEAAVIAVTAQLAELAGKLKA